jgi:hypothetical protein
MDIPENDNRSNFDPDFASPAEWAVMYRAYLLQVVPAKDAVKGGQWKMPDLKRWAELQNEIVPQFTFDRWYGPTGDHARRQNMGILTGRCSGNVFVTDLDDQKGPEAEGWWHGLLELHNNGLDIETVEQRTGGGGRQKLFRAPADWVAPTNKTSINIDIRGQGGFAMLPPSRHESGRDYEWLPGRAPWEVPIADAPEWLLEAIEALVERYGGVTNGTGKINTASPGFEQDAFGNQIDGREEYMTKLVWAAVIGLRRDSPIPPSNSDRDAVWADYERNTRSRLPDDARNNTERLEEEGRGPSLFANKWRRAVKKWDTKVAEEAAKPKPGEFEPEPEAALQVDPATGQPLPLVLTAAQFVAGFTPPAYLIDGILQRGYLYSLTARTGHGKTAVAMYMAQTIARALPMHGQEVKGGTVLILAGENPDDIRARFLVLADYWGFDAAKIKMRFVAGVIDIAAQMVVIEAAAAEIGDLIMVIVDTAAAYFRGDETNSNSQQGAYARVLRRLTFLPGKPAVLVCCHPIKNAARDNLLPMGGSAFLNEVDGNLTLWANAEKQLTLHWLGKFRGPEFEPLAFELDVADSDKVVDAEGRLMPSVVAKPVSELSLQLAEGRQESDESLVLRAININRKISIAGIATVCSFLDSNGRPQKSKVFRICSGLVEEKLLERRGTKFRITAKGRKELEDDPGIAGV